MNFFTLKRTVGREAVVNTDGSQPIFCALPGLSDHSPWDPVCSYPLSCYHCYAHMLMVPVLLTLTDSAELWGLAPAAGALIALQE